MFCLVYGGPPQTCKRRPRGGFVDLFVASKMYVGVGAAAFGLELVVGYCDTETSYVWEKTECNAGSSK